MHNSLRRCCSLQKNILYPPGHIKAQAFSSLDLLFFELGLDGSGVALTICSQDESQDSPLLFVTKSLIILSYCNNNNFADY